jgi:hypothetical protein
MATAKQIESVRDWEDVALIVLGFAAVVAPWVLPAGPVANLITLNALIVGLGIAGLAALDLFVPPHWEEPIEIAASAWLMASPSWLGYGGALATVHVIIGALVMTLAALEFWQDWKATRA